RTSAVGGITLKDGNGRLIPVTIRMASENTVVTILPNAPLKLDATFELKFAGITDGAGNRIEDLVIHIKTFKPQSLSSTLSDYSVKDVSFTTRLMPAAGTTPARKKTIVLCVGSRRGPPTSGP